MPAAVVDPLENRIRRIQRTLGVRADGVVGPETLSALEAKLDITASAKATSLECSIVGLEQIVAFEVTSKQSYEKRLRRPTWPGESSGVTIGIGYDLGMTSRAQIRSDWDGEIADADLDALLVAQGITGIAAKKLAQSLSAVSIPYDVAESVFFRKTLPRFASLTRQTWPGVDSLPPDAQAMLLSLLYNRGSQLTGARRTEMAEIGPLVKRGTSALGDIASKLESMQRLWPNSKGLRDRRIREAAIVRAADRSYRSEELIRL